MPYIAYFHICIYVFFNKNILFYPSGTHIIISKTDNKWVFCKHKERETYEIPGGHREPGESILETAKRELQEETGEIYS